MEAFWDGFIKQAAEKDNKPGYLDRHRGVVRATADRNVGGVIGIRNWDHIKSDLKGQATHGAVGAAGGAALGGLASMLSKGRVHPASGAGAGALLGGIVGGSHGSYQADKKYLADKGIKKKWGGLDHEFSDDAKKKYIDKK